MNTRARMCLKFGPVKFVLIAVGRSPISLLRRFAPFPHITFTILITIAPKISGGYRARDQCALPSRSLFFAAADRKGPLMNRYSDISKDSPYVKLG